MGLGSSMSLGKDEVDSLLRETGFTSSQLEHLHSRFKALDKSGNGYLTQEDLMADLHVLKGNSMRNHILNILIEDYGSGGQLNFRQFVLVFATFRRQAGRDKPVLNTRENRMRFLFNMYDRDKDNKISRDELLTVLSLMVGVDRVGAADNEHLESFVEHILAEIKMTGKEIDFATFCETLKQIDIDEKMSMKL